MKRALLALLLVGVYMCYVGGGLALGTNIAVAPARAAMGIAGSGASWLAVPRLLLSTMGQQVARQPDDAPPADGTRTGLGVEAPSESDSMSMAAAELPIPTTLLPHRRFTVLLLGSDNDLKFSPGAVLTQSMILVSIDPVTRQVAMISIPRDFWVPIAGYGYAKIDVAYEVGGISLARSTVERLFGIQVDYYAWVGLNGLVKVIDSLGGIDMRVLHPILDEAYPDDLNTVDPYAYFRLYIPAGPQHLDGTTALEYVRSRHGDLESDFGRSVRQQQVLLAIKQLLGSPGMVAHIPDLAAALSDSVQTDLTLPQVLQLANLGRGITADQVHQLVLSAPDYADLGTSPDGTESIVVPDWSAIRPAIARLLQPQPVASAGVTAERTP